MSSQLNTSVAQGTGVLVGGLSRDFADSTVLTGHGHDMGELKFALSGVMVVASTDGYWVVPPGRALWLAPNVRHKVRMLGKVQLRSVFINPGFWPGLPTESRILSVSPLFREVIIAVAVMPARPKPCQRTMLLMDLLLEEVNRGSTLPLHLPVPRDHRLARICTHIQEHLDDMTTLQEWARDLGYDQRTLHRLFVQELGLSFVQWRQQAKLLMALEWLAQRRSVLSIALELGYQTQSAFTAMFRKKLGITPSDFIKMSYVEGRSD